MKRTRSFNWRSAAARRLTEAASTPEVEQAVRVVCARLLDGVATSPTDLEPIMSKLGVQRWVTDDLPFAGELRRDGSHLEIAVSAHFSEQRKRFTIAHELGHAFFETTGPNPPRTGAELERLCDLIAVELLMPRSTFEDAAVELGFSLNTIQRLSRRFNTSMETTALRLADIKTCTVFLANRRGAIWGRGMIRKGALGRYSRELELSVRSAIGTGLGSKPLENSLNGDLGWLLEWVSSPNTDNALCVLRRPRRSEPNEHANGSLVGPPWSADQV